MPIRLIASDLDMTLIDESITLSPRSIEAYRRARDKGVLTTLASGRMYAAMTRYADALGVTLPVLACQGAVVVDAHTGKVLAQQAVPLCVAQDFLHFAAEEGVYAQYYSPSGYFMEKDCWQSDLYCQRMGGVKGTPVGGPLWEVLDYDPIKSIIIADPERIQALLPKAQARFGKVAQVTISLPEYLEITHLQASKGNGLRQLAAALDIDMADVMVFGDAPNDLSMITAAGYSVAVGNACPEVKAAAGYVTDSQKEDGVAKAIERFVLGEEAWPE